MVNNGRVLEMFQGSYSDKNNEWVVDRDGSMIRLERPIVAQTRIAIESANVINNVEVSDSD